MAQIMPKGDRDDPDNFHPPEISILVHCLHCGEEYDSWKIEFREGEGPVGYVGAWCCPTPGCDGVGFCFDIFPVDPEWTDENGEKVWFDDDDEEGSDEEEGGIADRREEDDSHEGAEYDPAEPHWQDPYTSMSDAEREAFDKSWENMTGDMPETDPAKRPDDALNDDDIPF